VSSDLVEARSGRCRLQQWRWNMSDGGVDDEWNTRRAATALVSRRTAVVMSRCSSACRTLRPVLDSASVSAATSRVGHTSPTITPVSSILILYGPNASVRKPWGTAGISPILSSHSAWNSSGGEPKENGSDPLVIPTDAVCFSWLA